MHLSKSPVFLRPSWDRGSSWRRPNTFSGESARRVEKGAQEKRVPVSVALLLWVAISVTGWVSIAGLVMLFGTLFS